MNSLEHAYDNHPVNAKAIKARLTRQRRVAETELDLAFDPAFGVTDQNHIGGVSTVIQLAEAVGIGPRSVVCDIGGGIGGSARCLATFFECHVDLIDISESRCRDARELNQLVGLHKQLSVQCFDARTPPVSNPKYDVLWGQSAWIHFSDFSRFLRHWSPTLTQYGRIAFEDSYLARTAAPHEIKALCQLQDIWNCQIPKLLKWNGEITSAGLTLTTFHDLSYLLEYHFNRLVTSEQHPDRNERLGWHLASEMAKSGLLGYGRWVAAVPADFIYPSAV